MTLYQVKTGNEPLKSFPTADFNHFHI